MELVTTVAASSADSEEDKTGEVVFESSLPIVVSDRFEEIKALKLKEFPLRPEILQEIIHWHDRFNPKKYLVEFHKNVNSAGGSKCTLICPDKNCGFNISIRYYKGFWKICKHPNFLEQLFHKDICTVDTNTAVPDSILGVDQNEHASIVNEDEAITVLKSMEFSSRAEALNAIREWQASLNPPKHVIGSAKVSISSSKTLFIQVCPDSNCEFHVSVERTKGVWKLVSSQDTTDRLYHSKGCTISGKNRLVRLSSPAIRMDLGIATSSSEAVHDASDSSNSAIISNDLSALKIRDFSCRSEVVHEVRQWHDRSFPDKCLVAFKRDKRNLKLQTLVCPDINCGFNISMQYTLQNHVGVWRIGTDPDFVEQLNHKAECAIARPEPLAIGDVAEEDHSTSAHGEDEAKPSSTLENLGILASCAQILEDDGSGSSSSSNVPNNTNNDEEIAALKNQEFSTRPEIVHAISLWQARQQPPKHLIGCNKSRCSSRHTLVCTDRNCGFNISIQCTIKNFSGTWKVGIHPDFVEQLQHSADCTPPVVGKVRARVAAEILLEKGKLDLKGRALIQKSQEMGFQLGKSFFSNKRFKVLGAPVKASKKKEASKSSTTKEVLEEPATAEVDNGGGNSSGSGSGKDISEDQKALKRKRAREGMAKYRAEMSEEQRSEERRKARTAMAKHRAQINANMLQQAGLLDTQPQTSSQRQRAWSRDSTVNSSVEGTSRSKSKGEQQQVQQQDSSNWEMVCTKMRMHIDQITQNPLDESVDESVEIGDMCFSKQPELDEEVAIVADGTIDFGVKRSRGRKRKVREAVTEAAAV